MRALVYRAAIWGSSRLWGRGLSRIPGVMRMHRSVMRTLVPPGPQTIAFAGGQLRLDPELYDEYFPEIAVSGLYEHVTTEVVRSLLRPGMVVVDAGANVGYYTLLASRAVGAEGEVVAFEPDPANFRALEENVSLNDARNVTAVQAAVTDTAGELLLHRHPASLRHSLFRGNVPPDAGEAVPVRAVTFDGYFAGRRPPDLVKCDTEGAEARVLAGARETIRRARPVMVLEFHPGLLEAAGACPRRFLEDLDAMGYSARMVVEAERAVIEGYAEIRRRAECRARCGNLVLEPR